MANLLVQSYRKDNPDTPLDDDQISIRFAEENAAHLQEIFKADPSYKADMDRIWGVTRTPDSAPADDGISGWDTTKQVYTQFMKGLAEQNIVTTGPETIGIGTSALGHAFDLPEEGFWNAPRDPKETATGAFAEFIKTDVHEFVTPEISEKKQGQMRNDFWRTTVPHGLGSGAGFILSGGFIAKALQGGIKKLAKETGEKVIVDIEKKALKRGMKADVARKFAIEQGNKQAQKVFQRVAARSSFKVTAGLGAIANGPQGYKDAIAEGATPGEAFQAWMLNMGVGTSEVFPMRKFIGRIGGIDKYIGKGLMDTLVNAGLEGAEEAAQEFLQGAAGNVIAKWIVKYDPDREILAEWKESAAAGGVTGVILSLATSVIGGRVRNITGEESGEAAPETDELLPDAPTIVARVYEGENKEAIVALAEREAREGYTREVEDEYYKIVGMGDRQDILAKELYDKTKNQALSRNAADDAVAEAEAQIDNIVDTAEPTEQELALLAEAEEVKGSPLTNREKINILVGNRPIEEDEEEATRRKEFFDEEEARVGRADANRDIDMEEASVADNEKAQQEEKEAMDAADISDRKNKAQTAATAQKNEDLSAWRAAREKQQAEAQPATEEVTPETEENLRQQLQEEQEDITEGTGTVNGQEIAKIAVDAVDNEKTGIAHSNNIKTVKSRIRKLKERLKGKTLNGKEIGEGEIEQLVPGLDELESEIEDYEGTVKLGLSKEDAKERRDEIREKWETLYGTDYSLETDESLEKATKPKPKPKAKPKAEAEIVLEPGESNAPEAFEEGQEAARKQAQTQVDKGNVGITSQVIEGVRERTDGPLSPEDVNLGEEAGGGFFTQNDNTSSGKLLDAEVNAYNTIANSKATTLAELKKEGIVSGGHSGIGYATSGKGKNVVYHITKDAVFIGEGGKTVEEALSNAKKRSAERIGAVLAKGGTVSAAGSGGKVTTRIAVLHSNDGKVVALGVHMTQSGKPMVKNLKGTTAKSMPLSELITKHGYIPVGSIRTVAGTKGFAEVYESRKDFDEKIGDNISELKKAEAEVAPLAEGVQEIGSAQTVPLQEGDQPIVRNAPRRAPRPSQEKVNTAFSNIVDAARTAGVDIKIVKGEFANVEKKATAYMTLEDGRVVATLAMESVNDPTQNNTLDLLHEINHVVFDQIDPAIQKALNDAMRAVSDEALGIEGSAFMFDSSFSNDVPNELVQEERLVEAVARKMEEAGFDPTTSKGLVSSLVRIWKNISFAAKMAWQKMLHGSDALSPTMAQEFFSLQVEAFLTGNSVPRFINYVVNPKTTLLEDVMHFTGDISSVFISSRGVVEVEPVTPDTVGGLRFNMKYAGINRYSPDGVEERTNVQQSRRDAATNNAVLQALRNSYAAYTASGANRNSAGEVLISEEAFINRALGKRGPVEILEEIETATSPEVAATTLKDLDEIEDRPRAALAADKFLTRVYEKLKVKWSKAYANLDRKNTSSLSAQRSKVYIALDELRKQYLNLSHISTKLLEGYQANLKKFNSDPKSNRTRIRSVLDSIDKELAHDKIAASEFQKQPTETELDTFYKMVEAGVDFTESWANIQKKILHLATAYVPTDTRSKIILAKFMVMAHDNPVAVEVLTLRGENPDHRTRFDSVLRMALKNDRNSVKRAFKAFSEEFSEEGKVKSGDFARFNGKIKKLLNKIEAYKDRYNHIDIAINQAREDIAVFEAIRNPFSEERAIVESLYDKEESFNGLQWEPVHDAEYMVPASPEQGLADVRNNKQQLDLSKKVDLSTVETHIYAMTAWLKNQPVSQRGAVWKTMKRQRDKLTELPADQAQREVSHSWILRILGDYTTKLELLGSAQARKMQQGFRSLSRNLNSYGGENAKRIGREWALALDNLKIAFKKNGKGQARESILDLYYSRAFHWFDSNREILNENPGDKGQRLLLNGYKKHWKADGKTDAAFIDAVWPQFEKLILATRKASSHINNIRKELGLSVKDEFDDHSFFREAIGDSLTTTMRKPSSEVTSVFAMLKDLGWNIKRTLESKGNIKEKYLEENQARYIDYVEKMFGGDGGVMKDFVGPLARKSGAGLLSSPTETGLTRPVPQAMFRQAYEENQTDFIGMLESLADSLGITEAQARADFVAESITSFQGVFRQIKTTQERETTRSSSALPPHIMMDARKTTNWPEEWVDYATFGERNMHQYAKHLSVEAAFGRDMGLHDKDMDRLERELQDDVDLKEKIDRELRAAGKNTTSKHFTGEYNKAFAEKAKSYGRPVKILKQADQRKQLLAGMKKNINNWLTAESGTPMEYYAFNDFMRTLAGFTVQGYGTALIDTISIVEQPFRKLGLGKAAFGHVLKNVGNSVGIGTGSLFQMFNKTIGFNAEKMQLLREFGLDDATASMEGNFFSRIKDNYRSTLSDEFVGSNILTRGVEYASRAGRAVLGSGAGRAEEGRGAFPALRVATPFTQLAKQSAMASTMSTWSQFQALVLKAAKLIKNNSKYAEILRNEGVLFDDAVLKKHGLSLKKLIKELGYGRSFIVLDDTRAFLHMTESLQRNGFTLERVAANYLTRKETDSKADPIGDKNLYRALANLAISETMLETDLTTRPSAMTSSSVGQFAMPLLGWSIAKTNDVVKELREPGGQQSMRGAYFSMMSLLAIAPVWMWYGAMRDWFDEEVVGKKSGVQQGKGMLNMPSLEQIGEDPVDSAQIALERLDRVGAFGIAGEAAVYGLGQFGGGVRDFGVDSRVFGINSFANFAGTWIKWGRQHGTATWQSVYRPMLQSLGFSGFLQTFQATNNVMGKVLGEGPALDVADYWINHRIGVQNYIRGAARNLNLDVRTLTGMRGTPSRLKAHVGQMVLAAYADDPVGFMNAKRDARAAAKDVDREGVDKRVLSAFMAYHPLRQPFKSAPTEREMKKVYDTIEESGGADARKGVEDAVDSFNDAVIRLGGNPYTGKKESSGSRSTFRQRPSMSRPQRPDYRARAASM